MANPPVLIDTSIFIEHLRKQDKTKSVLYDIYGAGLYGLPVMTLNARHFNRIPSLPLISPPDV